MEIKPYIILNKKIGVLLMCFLIFCAFKNNLIIKNLNSENSKILKDLQDQNSSHLMEDNNGSQYSSLMEDTLKHLESNCSAPFITVADSGRLGKNVCQFLALYVFKMETGMRAVVSEKMNTILRDLFSTVPLPHLPNPCFNTSTKSVHKISFGDLHNQFQTDIIDEESHQKLSLNMSNVRHYNFIEPFPYPPGLMMPHREMFHSLLKVKKGLVRQAKFTIKKALRTRKEISSDAILVGVHVRRSDYLDYTKRGHFGYPTLKFYFNAFRFFREKCGNVIFIVVSDDIKWCKENLSASDVIVAGNGEIRTPQLDFTLLSLCDHHIRGLGTFGFTSAFLGKGSAVVFRRRNLGEKSNFTLKDLSKMNFTCDSPPKFYYVDE